MGIGHSGLSGVRAATYELSTIGNNVSNAGTVGFKKSMAEFSDVISVVVGGGVEVSDLRQTFSQGSIQSTGNTWDLAVSGRGFFKVSEGSDDITAAVKDNYYTRNGSFGVDKDGFVVNSRGMRLHMFKAKNNSDGSVEFPVSTNTTEILIEQNDAQAKASETMFGTFNFDARTNARGSAVIDGAVDPLNTERLLVGSKFKVNGIEVSATGNAMVTGGDKKEITAGMIFSINGTAITIAAAAGGTPVMSDVEDAINAVKATTGVSAKLNAAEQLVLSSATTDIILKDGDTNRTLYNIGLHDVDEEVTEDDVTPAVTLATLANDINNSGTGASATVVDGNIKLYSSASITVEAAGTYNGASGGTTDDILTYAGLTATTVNATLATDETGEVPTIDPSDDLSYDHSVTSIIFDQLGDKQTINTFARKVTEGQWELFTQRVDSKGNTYPADETMTTKVGEVEFDSSGNLVKITSGEDGTNVVYDLTVLPEIKTSTKITIPTGSATVGDNGIIELDIAGTSQFASRFRIIDISQDGYASGSLTGVVVDESGVINASYTNGNTLQLGKVALFEFNNPQGLRQEGGVLWASTLESGVPRPGEPGESIFGRIKSQSLESSAVDVTEELVNLITAQRNFQANSKMISANKEMNQVVLNI